MEMVNWKWLVQLALLGSSGWNNMPSCWYAPSIGLFFAISGANKLFVAAARNLLRHAG